jgi:hypothetical protein
MFHDVGPKAEDERVPTLNNVNVLIPLTEIYNSETT